MVRLSIAIQHHPARQHLLANFSHLPHEVVEDHDPEGKKNPWRTYRACLERTPVGCTHRLVLQDDTQVCPGFLEAARKALEARPDRMVAFFVPWTLRRGSHKLMQACMEDQAWVELELQEWVPVVALCWPASLVPEFLGWADGRRYTEQVYRADDAIAGKFCQHRGVAALATVPSLVEHPDDGPSLIGNPRSGSRRARCYVGDGAHLIKWR